MKDLILNELFDIKLTVKEISIKDAEEKPNGGLLVTINATHAGYVNRNYYYYDPAGMKKAVDSWTKPFAKPIIKHHDDREEPLGRVVGARYVGNSTRGYTQLDVMVSDEEAIQKIRDGRYLTVSTSGKPVDYVKCSICGSNHLTSTKFCGHMRGRVYTDDDTGKKNRCYWKIGQMEYSEVSIVNKPADTSSTHAASIVNFRFSDEEGDVPENEQYNIEHSGIAIISDKLATPENDTDYRKIQLLIDAGFDIVANPDLMESIEDGSKKLHRYVEAGGTFIPFTHAEFWEPTDEELKAIEWIRDRIMDESGEKKYLTGYGKSGKLIRHRHVCHINEAGNGYTDYILGHSHEVVDGQIQKAKMWDSETETYREDPHTHKMEKTPIKVTGDSGMTDSEGQPNGVGHDDPNSYRGPVYPDGYRKRLTLDTKDDVTSAIRLVSQYPKSADLSRIEDYIRYRGKVLGLDCTDKLASAYRLLAKIEKVL